MQEQNQGLVQELQDVQTFIIGDSKIALEMRILAKKLGETDHKVLIQGETGVGKENAAREIHKNGRQDKPFVPVNCSALPENLIESELFGHKKGSFTGAIEDRKGYFETVEDGTLLLDEIGTLPLPSQVKILRVLQDGVFSPVGDRRPIQLKARVIAGTNIDLENAIHKGEFRSDLFHRLNVIPFFVPPLRERLEDVPLLVEHFLNKEQGEDKLKRFTAEAMVMMQGYHWPGNIRELENAVARAVFFSNGEMDIKVGHLCLHPKLRNMDESDPVSGDEFRREGRFINFYELEELYLRKLLVEARGNVYRSAIISGLHRNTIIRQVSEFKLEHLTNKHKK
ncbi:MAG: sigma-54 dependent transcriptional regulator [Candidatus Paceibacterota bacterium]|jgi:transcriptional regulator with GAF, ATPase, and Fis domain